MKKVLVALFVACAAANAAPVDDAALHHDDPYLNRVIEEALDLGESTLLERALTGATQTKLSLEHPSELESSLLSVSQEIFGSPAAAHAKLNASPASKSPSANSAASFNALLSESEEARLIEQKKAEILADKQSDDALLNEFNQLTANVDSFDHKLNSEGDGSLKSLLEAGSGAEVEEHATSHVELSAEQKMEQELEAEVASEEEQEQGHEEEADEEADAETEADADAEDEAFFLEVETVLNTPTRSLKDALAAVDAPAAEDEVLEPTLLEEIEMEELTASKDIPTSTFIMTNEEFSAQLDNLAKTM